MSAWAEKIIRHRPQQPAAPLKELVEKAGAELPSESPFSDLVEGPDIHELLLLCLGLLPHARPGFLGHIFSGKFPALGGLTGEGQLSKVGLISGVQFDGLLPSGHTFLYLCAGENLAERLAVQQWLCDPENRILADKHLIIAPQKPLEPVLSGVLFMPPPTAAKIMLIPGTDFPGYIGSTL